MQAANAGWEQPKSPDSLQVHGKTEGISGSVSRAAIGHFLHSFSFHLLPGVEVFPVSTFPGCGTIALSGIAQLDQNLAGRPLDRCGLAEADEIIGKLQASRDETGV